MKRIIVNETISENEEEAVELDEKSADEEDRQQKSQGIRPWPKPKRQIKYSDSESNDEAFENCTCLEFSIELYCRRLLFA